MLRRAVPLIIHQPLPEVLYPVSPSCKAIVWELAYRIEYQIATQAVAELGMDIRDMKKAQVYQEMLAAARDTIQVGVGFMLQHVVIDSKQWSHGWESYEWRLYKLKGFKVER